MTRKVSAITKYRKQIVNALKANDKYNEGLELTINSTADTLRTLDICRKDIDTLDKTTIEEEGRYGKRLAPHPVFKIQRDAQDTLTKNCKTLGLTYAELSEAVQGESPLEMMMRELSRDDG